jgi:hypothetical protein
MTHSDGISELGRTPFLRGRLERLVIAGLKLMFT